jgi:hypothetical protein
MADDADLPNPEAYARRLTKNELLDYKAIYGEKSREWIIAKRELARRFPTPWQRTWPWLLQGAWAALVVYVVYRLS